MRGRRRTFLGTTKRRDEQSLFAYYLFHIICFEIEENGIRITLLCYSH